MPINSQAPKPLQLGGTVQVCVCGEPVDENQPHARLAVLDDRGRPVKGRYRSYHIDHIPADPS